MLAYHERGSKITKRAYLPNDRPDERWNYAIARFLPVENFAADLIILPHCRYEFHMSVVKQVRVMRPEDAAEIELLDQQIEDLMNRRQAVLDESFKRGRPLHQRDIDPNWEKE